MRSPPAMAFWMFVHRTAICWIGWLKRCEYPMKVMMRPSETLAPSSSAPLSSSQPPPAATIASARYPSASKAGARALVKATARTLASRLAALVARKLSRFSSARLKACTSRTAEIDSCSSAFTLPSSARDTRNARRAWFENHTVVIAIKGTTARLNRA